MQKKNGFKGVLKENKTRRPAEFISASHLVSNSQSGEILNQVQDDGTNLKEHKSMQRENKNIKMSFPKFWQPAEFGNFPLFKLLLKEEKQPCFIRQVEGPRQKPSGMTTGLMGFTLIELLVVVLIIGILAAVAVPQYKLVVAKSRIQAMVPLIKSIAVANDVYYLSNGKYSFDMEALDVTLPANCEKLDASGIAINGQLWRCGNDFVIDNSGNAVILLYCPGKNTTYGLCSNNRIIHINAFLQHISPSYAGKISCAPSKEEGFALCKLLKY